MTPPLDPRQARPGRLRANSAHAAPTQPSRPEARSGRFSSSGAARPEARCNLRTARTAKARPQSRPRKLLQTPKRVTESGTPRARQAPLGGPPAPPPAAWRQQKAVPEQRRRPCGRTYPASSSFLLALIWSPSAPFWFPLGAAVVPPPDAAGAAGAAAPAPDSTGASPSGAASCPFSVAPVVSMGCSSAASDMVGQAAAAPATSGDRTSGPAALPELPPTARGPARPLTSPPMTPRGPTLRGRRRELDRAHARTPGALSAYTSGAAPLGRRRTQSDLNSVPRGATA